MNPIEAAVAPLKDRAVALAAARAEQKITEVLADLHAHGWSLKAAAPHPRSNMSRRSYKEMQAKHNLYRQLTDRADRTNDPNAYLSSVPGADDLRISNDASEVHFVKQFKEAAAASYDAYVAKLVKKVGPVKSADLYGESTWAHSNLHVVTEAGERQVWRTQMILNVSVLGTLFNQWPTRQVKS
jgi:hypothetical protein